MSGKAQYEIPAVLKQAQERFAEWRSSHTGRRPIPESLWALASELAGQHGVFSHGSDTSAGIHQAEAAHPGGSAGRKTAIGASSGFRGTDDVRRRRPATRRR
jgi:hypothetical protein